MVQKGNNNSTLCWKCRNAIPKMKDGKYIKGCSWSVRGIPVFGWIAKKRILYNGKNGKHNYISYCVKKCPDFIRG